MSYATGLAAMTGGGDRTGALWTSDREIRNYLAQTQRDMANSKSDIWKFVKASSDEKIRDAYRSFLKFYDLWHKWFWSTDGKAWLTTVHVETARQYRKRLKGWRKIFSGQGHDAATPEPDTEPLAREGWKTIAYGAAGVVAGAVLLSLIRR